MLNHLLAQRQAENRPIRVGIIGAGKFGAGLVAQISQMQGMETSVIADINLDHARHAYESSGIPASELTIAETSSAIDGALSTATPVITEDALALARSELVDVVVEATGVPAVGARTAYEAISNAKHVVMVNVEADVTVGAILRRHADSAGVVYTLVDGDQPGVTMNIVEWAQTLGFEIVAAGRGTIYLQDDFEGTPDTVPERFGFSEEMLERRTINLKMYNSFRDGTKAQVEMTALANAAGLVPDVRGMHEPSANLADIPRLFSLREEGGLLSRHGVVELANSVAEDGQTPLPNPLNMGVFVVVRTEHPFTQEDLRSYYVYPGGNGHNYLLYRPYHLVAVAAPISIAKAALYGVPTGSPLPTPAAEVITVAKRDLQAGERLDGGGGYTVNGLCERAEVAHTENLLPLGLASGALLVQDVAKGTAISYDMVEKIPDSFIARLRRLQDATVWENAG
jgi:predicted homoserine dehydrogenase-like protein